MTRSFRHKGLELFFRTGQKSGIQAHHEGKLRPQLDALNHAEKPEDLSAPGWHLHPLKGDMAGHFALTAPMQS